MAGEDRQTQDSGAGGQYYRPELDALRFFAFLSAIRYGRIEIAIRSLGGISAGLLLTILFAAASYRFLEKPFLKLKERFTFVTSRAV